MLGHDTRLLELSNSMHEGDAAVLVERARLYMDMHEYHRAVDDLSMALRDGADQGVRGPALLARGIALGELGRADEGKLDLDQLLAMEGASEEAYLARAAVQVMLSDYSGAYADYSAALRLEPASAAAQAGRGYCLDKTGEYDRARHAYEEALGRDLGPKAPFVRFRLAKLLYRQRDLDASLACLTGAGPLQQVDQIYLHALLLRALDRPEDAVQVCGHGLALYPDAARLYKLRGVALHALGRYPEAVLDYDAVLGLMDDPSTEERRVLALTMAESPQDQDQGLEQVLARLGLTDYLPGFTTHRVHEQDLVHLTTEEVRVLVPHAGPRSRLECYISSVLPAARRPRLERRGPPKELVCPVTLEVMEHPVVLSDGHSYERDAIAAWFALGHRTSPVTNLPLDSLAMYPNHALKSAIEAYSSTEAGI